MLDIVGLKLNEETGRRNRTESSFLLVMLSFSLRAGEASFALPV